MPPRRQQEILSHLDVRGAMSIRELAAVLFVSEASVRARMPGAARKGGRAAARSRRCAADRR